MRGMIISSIMESEVFVDGEVLFCTSKLLTNKRIVMNIFGIANDFPC